MGIAIVISRTLSSKAHMASIPKGYIPTGEDDVPKVSGGMDASRSVDELS